MLVYADMPRWEIQMRFRRNEISNLGVENRTLDASLQYKRGYFVDWRVADRLSVERTQTMIDITIGSGRYVFTVENGD
jgi:hypothetical protein